MCLIIVMAPEEDERSGLTYSRNLSANHATIQDNELPISHSDPEAEDPTFLRRRLIRTSCMAPFYLTLGLYSGIISTVIPDLQEELHKNVAQISMGLMPKSIGILSGSISGALISDRFRKYSDLCLFVASFVAGSMNIAIPWAPNLPLLGIFSFLQGLGHGTINVVCSSVTMGEWRDKSQLPVNYLHLFHSIGGLIAPLSAAPFLSPDANYTHNDTSPRLKWISTSMNIMQISERENSYYVQDELSPNGTSHTSMLYVPFAIHGGIGVAIAILFLGFHLSGWEYRSAQDRPPSSDEATNMSSLPGMFQVFVSILAFFIYVAMINRDKSIGMFNFSIALASLHMTKQRAAIYNTVYSASWVLGRGLGTILVKFIRVHWLVFGGTGLALVANVLIYIYALDSETLFWVLTCLIGIFSGPCYACVMTWLNEYIPAGGVLVAIIDIGIGLGGFIASWVGGEVLLQFGSRAIFVQSLLGTVVIAAISLPLQLIFSLRGNRFLAEALPRLATNPSSHSDNNEQPEERTPLIGK